MLLDLPPELLVSVLKYLPVSDISACACTSKAFKDLIDQHESTIYRQAAAHPSLSLIPHDHILFSDILPHGFLSRRYLGDVDNWKNLCRRALNVRSCWLGKGPSRVKNYNQGYANYPSVHRIKVDERRGFVITTHGQHNVAGQGRVVVSDINDGTAIFQLGSHHVRRYAHCEYGEGFLIFDRSMDAKEVWRLVSVNPEIPDPEAFEVVPESQPGEAQLTAATSSPEGRLKFVPHALLRPPNNIPTRAFRFVYPTLLVAASDCLLLWDVRTGTLVDRMDGISNLIPPSHNPTANLNWPASLTSSTLGTICYVEVNEKYALLRKRGRWISMWKNSGKVIVNHKTELTDTNQTPSPFHDDLSEHCIAETAHFSPCGKHLAILAHMSRLLIIPYFERVLDGRVRNYHDIMIDLQLGASHESIYLAYENDRIGIVTQLGVFIVHPIFPPPDDLETPPKVHVQRVPLLNDPQLLFYVSCLQMTSTSLWINWEVEEDTPGIFSSSPGALQQIETDEQSFEESLDTVAFFHPSRWPGNSVVISVDFGLGSES
ncbi:hypothetical protein AN958_02972 [Leucoagaricus sp. SymC.cos]|nr:hypothetical protein AN958_02972 [Leucoagaricus sp. SymC.cos]